MEAGQPHGESSTTTQQHHSSNADANIASHFLPPACYRRRPLLLNSATGGVLR